jgi:opacity protein-like surface antigen
MRCRILCAGLLASVAAGAGSAIAADYAVRPMPAVPQPVAVAPAYVPDWAGFYVGIHGGGGSAHTSIENQFNFSPLLGFVGLPPSFVGLAPSPSGGVFGFQAGHNWQWGPAVGGLEIDFSGASIHGTASTSGTVTFVNQTTLGVAIRDLKVDALSSARGRLGYLIFPNWLLYGTAGISWGHANLTSDLNFPALGGTSSTTALLSEFGWVAGGGLEWKLADHWLLRGEYLHYDFGKATAATDVLSTVSSPAIGSANPFSVNVRNTVDVARAALSYKF